MTLIHSSHSYIGGFRCERCNALATSIEAALRCSDVVQTAAEWEANMAAAHEPVEIDWLDINKGASIV